MTSAEGPQLADVFEMTESRIAGARLDDDHRAETNGRMAVCRRCGFGTEGPEGKHAPYNRQLAAVGTWLDAQQLSARIALHRRQRDT